MVWQWLVSNWIRTEATRAAQAAFSEAMHQRAATGNSTAESTPRPDPATPVRCDLGLVCALAIESGALRDRLSGILKTEGAGFVAYQGGLEGRGIVIVESGPGGERAAQAARALIRGHRPRWVMSAGFAGGLHETLEKGDILLANSVVNEAGDRLSIDVKMDSSPRLHIGRLLTVDKIVQRPEEKQALGQQFDALAVDMETFAVAQACQTEHARFFSVRAISDTVHDRLPREVENLLRQKTLVGRLGAVTGSVFRRPSSVKDMWQLKEDAIIAGERLADFIATLVKQLN